MSAKHLIRNATVVSMDPKIGIQDNCDVLINGQLIEAVGRGLAEVEGANVIDGTDAIVCPGFIDTHRHMWQTQLAGLLSDGTLVRKPTFSPLTNRLTLASSNTSAKYEASTEAATPQETHI